MQITNELILAQINENTYELSYVREYELYEDWSLTVDLRAKTINSICSKCMPQRSSILLNTVRNMLSKNMESIKTLWYEFKEKRADEAAWNMKPLVITEQLLKERNNAR